MSALKITHWVAIGSLGYYVLKHVVVFRFGGAVGDWLAIALWLFLLFMLFRRPKSWGFGIGVFLLFTVAVQIGLWRAALTSPRKEELGISDSWMKFGITAVPLLVAAICSISLRWIREEEPNQSLQPTAPSRRG